MNYDLQRRTNNMLNKNDLSNALFNIYDIKQQTTTEDK